jgi:hypothetical protein
MNFNDRRNVTWDHVRQANVGPHGEWNGNGGGDAEVDEETQKHLGVDAHQAKWSKERVPLSSIPEMSSAKEFAKPCNCGDEVECPQCYSRAAAQHGPPMPLVHASGKFHAPDGRHRIGGALALGRTHIDAFVARKP